MVLTEKQVEEIREATERSSMRAVSYGDSEVFQNADQ